SSIERSLGFGVASLRLEQLHADRSPKLNVARIEFGGLEIVRFGLLPMPETPLDISEVFVDQRAVRQTLLSFVISLQRAGEIAQNAISICPLRQPCLAQVRLERDRFVRCILHRRRGVRVLINAVEIEKALNQAEPRPCDCKVRIKLHCFRIGCGSLLVGGIAKLPMLDSEPAKVGLVSGGNLRRFFSDSFSLRTSKLRI